MDISDKLLVEQAWALQKKLNRQIDLNRNPFSIGRMVSSSPTISIENLNYVHERAYSRYLRRLKKFWA